MNVPSAYRSGYEKARALNPELAAKYVEQTAVGDPGADAVIDALASFDQQGVHRFIQAGMEQDSKALADAPLVLREFFERIETPPPWFDPDSVHAGCRAFHEYSDLFIPAFFVVTLQNAATLISKAFYMTGRFIGPDLEDEAWLREACAIPRPTPSKFEKLGAADRAALAEACRPGLERLGYPL